MEDILVQGESRSSVLGIVSLLHVKYYESCDFEVLIRDLSLLIVSKILAYFLFVSLSFL